MNSNFKGLILISLLLFSACIEDTKRIEPKPVDIQVIRFDTLLMASDSTDFKETFDALFSRYPDFSDVYFHQILAPTTASDMDSYQLAKEYVTHPFTDTLYQQVMNNYMDFSPWEKKFEKAFGYYDYYFPEQQIPRLYTCISEFGVGSFTVGEDILGIGLEFYLGEGYPYDLQLFPQFIQHTMTAEYIVPKGIETVIENLMAPPAGDKLIDVMIRNGAALYIKDNLLPEVPQHVVFEFTDDQMSWIGENEAQIWAHLLNEELLFESDFQKFQKLVSSSPFVPGMPPEAPGGVANWIGYRIISSYAEEFPHLPLSFYLDPGHAQQILNKSGYKPSL